MAYLRGRYYLWGDGENLNLWDAGDENAGLGHWDEQGDPRGDRVKLPDHLADSFAVMRFAELLVEGRLSEVIDQTVGIWNVGCMDLQAYAGQIKEWAAGVREVPVEEYPWFLRTLEDDGALLAAGGDAAAGGGEER